MGVGPANDGGGEEGNSEEEVDENGEPCKYLSQRGKGRVGEEEEKEEERRGERERRGGREKEKDRRTVVRVSNALHVSLHSESQFRTSPIILMFVYRGADLRRRDEAGG